LLTPRVIALLTLCSLPALARTGTPAAQAAPPEPAEPAPVAAEPAPPPAEPAPPPPAEPAPPPPEPAPPFAGPAPPVPSKPLPSPALAESVPRTDIPDDYWDPPVITPTGQPSRVSESPSTTFVVTGDEIRHAGATSIPEILRRVPGMDVRLLGATDGQIGPRGFAFEVADRVLVMVDGRTAYVDFFGGTAYDMLPVSPLDIDRIEVVLGPGASVYGDKAMLGTLNIITRSAAAFPGFEARVDAGPPGDVRAAFRDGVVIGDWRARLTGIFRQVTPYPVDTPTLNEFSFTTRSPAGGGTASLGYAPSPSTEVSLESGVMTGDTYLLPTGSVIYPFDSTLGYAKADAHFGLGGPGSPDGDVRLKAVWNFGRIRGIQVQPTTPVFPSDSSPLYARFQTPYAEASHEFRFQLGDVPMQARWGGEVRLNTLYSTITRDVQPIWNIAGFASDEAVIGRWRITGGLRIDHQNRTEDFTANPRASIVFSPTPAHQLRIAYNEGYNNPSLIQNFAYFMLGPTPPLLGKLNLYPERIYYGEAAYGGTIARWLRLFANAFAYKMTDSITLGTNLQWQNSSLPANAYGGEVGFEVAPSRMISGYANYAYLHLSGGPYNAPNESDSPTQNLGSPLNKITGGLRLDLPRRTYLTADGQYVGPTSVARLNDSSASPTPYVTTSITSYVVFDARAGVMLDDGLDLSIAGTDLLNQTQAQLLGAQNPRLRVMATIAYTP
jgi:iron complex outermembrane receptor protein